MSHFVTLVLVDKKTKNTMKALEAAIEPILAPYDENIEMEKPYKRKCYCVGKAAERSVWKQLEKEFGDIDTLRVEFNNSPEQKKSMARQAELYKLTSSKNKLPKGERKKLHKEISTIEKESTAAWQKLIRLEERDAKEQELLAQHKKKDQPDPKCEDCKGTGERETTYNPKSKWDWYCVGGRWTGFLDFSGYDPCEDPDNYEKCHLCEGTGKRAEPPEAGAGSYPCNGCDGSGKSLKFSLKPVGYALPVSEIVSHLEHDKERDLTPFAIVTKDGWFERGRMGWFACVSDEKDEKKWKAETLTLLKQYKDKLAVVVDCHI